MRKKHKTKFPVARIKKIMQMDEDVGKMAQATPVLVAKAVEMFMQSLIDRSCEETRLRSAKRMSSAHLKRTINGNEQFDFLKDVVASVPDLQDEGGPAPAKKGETELKTDPVAPSGAKPATTDQAADPAVVKTEAGMDGDAAAHAYPQQPQPQLHHLPPQPLQHPSLPQQPPQPYQPYSQTYGHLPPSSVSGHHQPHLPPQSLHQSPPPALHTLPQGTAPMAHYPGHPAYPMAPHTTGSMNSAAPPYPMYSVPTASYPGSINPASLMHHSNPATAGYSMPPGYYPPHAYMQAPGGYPAPTPPGANPPAPQAAATHQPDPNATDVGSMASGRGRGPSAG
ncbi:hypothetical protein IWQ60_007310 [Tieghemiomyces parasiticus]|uniref:Transcription factor CBF/NF-Y/archaeal histone domain-containing protein n=1 Tax=Tieghemiomyces parasiticus TaxID=78921 RepID=A0A9W7ZYC5_9FUNG|nr:hypothetical protein IWQ60_007310 [Tieghemiomyces parasiticus]